jgi:hypothetical protein
MESRAQGTLKEKLTSYLEFENSDTYTANSAAEAQRDLASVYQICTDLLANKVYKK